MNLAHVTTTFRTEEDCLEFLAKQRWPDGVRCPTCGCDKICKGERTGSAKNKRTRFYQCLEKTCKSQFSATNGTMFHRSHIPLSLWFMAINIIMDAKKGMSALQLQRHLGLGSYKTAWYMCHRIRKSMEMLNPTPMTGIVEIDETYIGGTAVRKFRKNPKPRKPKDTVLALRERSTKEKAGRVRFFHVPDATLETLKPIIKSNTEENPHRLITDGSATYEVMFAAAQATKEAHRAVNHSKEWVVPGTSIHTNTVESSFSLLKRGIIGSFHWISPKHLHRYLSEFEYRFNAREFAMKFEHAMANMVRAPHMSYADLIA